MKSPIELRVDEVGKLVKDFDAAVERLCGERLSTPALDIYNFGYIDGSVRGHINHLGNYTTVDVHQWLLGEIFDRKVYIYQEADWNIWKEVRASARYNPSEYDLQKYGLAVTDPSVVMYHNDDMYVRTVDFEDTLEVDRQGLSTDTIYSIRMLLRRFYLPRDVKRRIRTYLAGATHSAETLLSST